MIPLFVISSVPIRAPRRFSLTHPASSSREMDQFCLDREEGGVFGYKAKGLDDYIDLTNFIYGFYYLIIVKKRKRGKLRNYWIFHGDFCRRVRVYQARVLWSFLILEHIVSKEDYMLIKAQLEGDSIVLKNTLFSFILTIYSSWKLAWDNDKFVKCRARKSLVHLSLMNCKIWTVTLRLHHESIIHRLCSPTLKFADQNPNVCRLSSSRKVSKKFFVCLKPHARESSTLNR